MRHVLPLQCLLRGRVALGADTGGFLGLSSSGNMQISFGALRGTKEQVFGWAGPEITVLQIEQNVP